MFGEIPEAAVWTIYFAPLAAFVVIVAGLRDRPLDAGRLTIGAIGLSWLLSLWAMDSALAADGVALDFGAHEWFSLGSLQVDVGVNIDGLSAMMLVVVTQRPRCWCRSTRRATCMAMAATRATSPTCRSSPRRCWAWCWHRACCSSSCTGSWWGSPRTC